MKLLHASLVFSSGSREVPLLMNMKLSLLTLEDAYTRSFFKISPEDEKEVQDILNQECEYICGLNSKIQKIYCSGDGTRLRLGHAIFTTVSTTTGVYNWYRNTATQVVIFICMTFSDNPYKINVQEIILKKEDKKYSVTEDTSQITEEDILLIASFIIKIRELARYERR